MTTIKVRQSRVALLQAHAAPVYRGWANRFIAPVILRVR
jgi:hypothetical protein